MSDLLAAVDSSPAVPPSQFACEQCSTPFEPRKHSGGKMQKFCSPKCRAAFHADPQRSQHNPTRERSGDTDEPGEPTATERRSMLIAADREFTEKVTETAPELVDRLVAERKLELLSNPPASETCEDFDWKDSHSVVLREQPETAIYCNQFSEIVIRQRRWPDDDPFIYITRDNLQPVIDRLCDLAGIPSAGK